MEVRRNPYAWMLLLTVPFFTADSFAERSPADDEAVLAIDTGRLVVVLNQASALLKAGGAKEPVSEDPVLELDFVIARYNMLREIACAKGIVEGSQCSEVYTPKLKQRPVPTPILRHEVNDAEDHILPFWEAVCAKLDDPKHSVCQTE